MHRVLLASVAIALASTVSAQRRSALDTSIAAFRVPNLSPCIFEATVEQLARTAGVLVGFERTSNCTVTETTSLSVAGEVFSGMTVRAALDRLMVLDTSYRWEERDGVAVIRPTAAWIDPNDALNLPAASFDIVDADLGITLGASLRVKVPPSRSGDALLTRPLSVAVSGGTVLDALNAIIRAHRDSGWYASVDLAYFRDLSSRFSVEIRTFGGSSLVVATPVSNLRRRQ